MLPASQTTSRSRSLRGYRLVVFLTTMLMAYTLMVGWGLIGGMIRYQNAYLLIALPCFAPVIAYAYGFWQVRETEYDWGLLLSAIGWACATLALLVQHNALQRQLSAIGDLPYGVPGGGLETGALLCLILAISFIMGGAALSLHAWNRERSAAGYSGNDYALPRR